MGLRMERCVQVCLYNTGSVLSRTIPAVLLPGFQSGSHLAQLPWSPWRQVCRDGDTTGTGMEMSQGRG